MFDTTIELLYEYFLQSLIVQFYPWYRVTSIKVIQELRVSTFLALGKRSQVDDDGRRRSRIHNSEVKCQTARHRDATSLLRIRCDEFLAIRERGLRPRCRLRRRPGSRRSPKKRFNALSEGDRERCLRQHVLWAWSNAKEIYCLARVFMAYPRASSDIYLHRGSSAECTSRPNNCFWKCEQRALINASVVLQRNISYDLLEGKVCRVGFCFYFGRPAASMFFYFHFDRASLSSKSFFTAYYIIRKLYTCYVSLPLGLLALA